MQFRILLLLSILLLINCSPKNLEDHSLLLFVPENASVVIKINDFKTFTTELDKNELVKKLLEFDISSKVSESLSALRYVSPSQESLISFTTDSINKVDFIFVATDTVPYINISNVTDRTIETLQFENLEVKKYTVEGIDFYSGRNGTKEIISSSLEHLKNLLSTIKHRDVHSELTKFYNASNKTKLGHVWINLNKSDRLWTYFTKSEGSMLPSKYADWLILDVSLDNEGLFLNGISTSNPNTKKYLSLFSKTKPLSNETFSMIPENATSFKSYTIDDYTSFSLNQKVFLERNSPIDSLFNTVEEFGIATINQQQIVLLKTYGTDELADYLKQIRQSTIDFQGNEIWQLSETSFIENRLQPIVEDFKSNYCCVLENTLVFGSEQESLQRVITSYKAGNTITETTLFQDIQQLSTNESTILTAANAIGFKKTLNSKGLKEIANQFSSIKFSGYLFGSEIISDADFFHSSYFIKKIRSKKTKENISSLFKVPFDTDLISSPQFVTNHRTKKGELIVQDADNILYLISTNGNILWKKQLESSIQGKVHQVDLFKNNKLQLAFTTGNKFLVLDRNGKSVAPFSFSFPEGNLNQLAVFDYDGKKDYRFVVTQNEKVFMYNNTGEIVTGFKYTSAGTNILDAPQHFRIKKKDYLVFKLADNTLKILNRVGRERINIKEKISFSDNPVRLFKGKITLTSTSGNLYQIGTNGSIEKTNLGLNRDHGMDATSKTLAIVNDNILSIRGKKTVLDLGVYSKPSIFYLNDKIYISVTDIQNQKTYLFDSQSKAIPGFPVFGVSAVDMINMDTDKRPELVIKDQSNSLTVFKIN